MIILGAICAGMILFPVNASATYLHRVEAEAGIILYEEENWKVNTLVNIDNCHRYNAVHISCIAKWKLGEYEYIVRDYVSIHHGIEVVSPAEFEILLVGEKGNTTVTTRL